MKNGNKKNEYTVLLFCTFSKYDNTAFVYNCYLPREELLCVSR